METLPAGFEEIDVFVLVLKRRRAPEPYAISTHEVFERSGACLPLPLLSGGSKSSL